MPLAIKRTGAADYGQYVKMLICGVAGSGKTLTSSTAPNPIFASAEGGLMSIADRHIPYANIRSSDDLVALKNSLDQSPDVREQIFGFPIDTIVIDTIDEIQRILVNERLKETKKANFELKDWGWLGEQMTAIISGFRNLEAHVIFLCHLKETSDGDSGRVWIKPGLQGAIGDQIANYVDLALLLKADTKTTIANGTAVLKTTRVLQTYPEPLYPWVKDRSGKLPMEVEVNFADDFARIHHTIFGNIQQPQPKAEVHAELTEAEPDAQPEQAAPEETKPEPISETAETETGTETSSAQVTEAEPAKVFEDAPVIIPDEKVPDPKPAKEDTRRTVATVTAVDAPPHADSEEKYVCESCNGMVESEDQADLSRIRFRKVLCKSCMTEEKAKRGR